MDIFYECWELVEVYFGWLGVFLDIFHGFAEVSRGTFWVGGVKWNYILGKQGWLDICYRLLVVGIFIFWVNGSEWRYLLGAWG